MRTKSPCPSCGTPHTTHGLIFYKGEQMCHKCYNNKSTRMIPQSSIPKKGVLKKLLLLLKKENDII